MKKNNKGLLTRLGVYICLLFQMAVAKAQQLPIKPMRTIAFATNEGSYMNIDVSPDGKTLAFDLLGDLYTVPSIGGKATQITRGIALNIHPVWSPDGTKLAFLSDASGDYKVSFLDLKTNIRLNIGSTVLNKLIPLWSPDGNFIYNGTGFYGVIGGELSKQNMKDILRFSTDGKVVYGIDSNKLYGYDLQTRSKRWLSRNNVSLPGEISPDGNWWCYVKEDSTISTKLIGLNLSTGKEKVLVNQLVVADPRYKPDMGTPHFGFSPDSKGLYISYLGKIHHITLDNGQIDIIPFSADVKIDLGPLNYNTYPIKNELFQVKYARNACVSPDNRHLVFAALNKIWVKDLPNGMPRMLAEQSINQFQPVISPDSKWVAYVSWCDTAGGQLWKVPVTGGRPEQLTDLAGQYQHPVWLPDGKGIAVIKGGAVTIGDKTLGLLAVGKGLPSLGDRDDPGIGQLEVISANGGHIYPITDSVPLVNHIMFSDNGMRINYKPFWHLIDKEQIWESSSADLHGKNIKGSIAVNGVISWGLPIDVNFSPNKKFFVYSAFEDLFLQPVNNAGDSSIILNRRQSLPVIRFSAGVDPYWEQEGKVLAWTYGNHFYRVRLAKLIASAEQTFAREQSSGVVEKEFITTNVIPDEDIPLKITVPTAQAIGIIALKNARIITLEGGRVIEKGTVLIHNGRFLAVGASGQVTIPATAKTYDLGGKTIIPGLIDVHLHMRVPSDIFPQQSILLMANLAYGITTARDPSQSLDGFGYAELIRSGQMLGPRLFTVGRAIRSDNIARMDDLADALKIVQKRAVFGGTEIKQYEVGDRMQREWLGIASRQQGLNMTNEGAYDPIRQIAMIKDGSTGVEHNPGFGDVYKDIITLYAKSGSYLTPTLNIAYDVEPGKEYFKEKYWHRPNDEKLKRFTQSDPNQTEADPRDNGAETLQTILLAHSEDTIHPEFIAPAHIDTRILKAGGKITLGGHGNDEGIGSHNEIWALVMGGFTNMQALQSATIRGAEALGIQKDLGSIEVGKIADLVILNSNPLDDIHNTRDIKYVMKDGILYDGDTLDELWPVKKKCPIWKSPKVLGNGYVNSPGPDPKSGGVDEPDIDNE